MDQLGTWLAVVCMAPGAIGLLGQTICVAVRAAKAPGPPARTCVLPVWAHRISLVALLVAAVALNILAQPLHDMMPTGPRGYQIVLLALAMAANTAFIVWFLWLRATMSLNSPAVRESASSTREGVDRLGTWLAMACLAPGAMGLFGQTALVAIAAANTQSVLAGLVLLPLLAYRVSLAALVVAAVALNILAQPLHDMPAGRRGYQIVLLALAMAVNTAFFVWFFWSCATMGLNAPLPPYGK